MDSGVYLIDAATREPIKEVAVQGFFESGGDVSDSTNPSKDVLDAPWAGTETTEILLVKSWFIMHRGHIC